MGDQGRKGEREVGIYSVQILSVGKLNGFQKWEVVMTARQNECPQHNWDVDLITVKMVILGLERWLKG